jgi:hypothetical protein
MAHGDHIADNIPLAKGLDHPDKREQYCYDAPNQSDLDSLLPNGTKLTHLLCASFSIHQNVKVQNPNVK